MPKVIQVSHLNESNYTWPTQVILYDDGTMYSRCYRKNGWTKWVEVKLPKKLPNRIAETVDDDLFKDSGFEEVWPE